MTDCIRSASLTYAYKKYFERHYLEAKGKRKVDHIGSFIGRVSAQFMGLFKKKVVLVAGPLSASEVERQAVLDGKSHPHHTVPMPTSEDEQIGVPKKTFCQQCLTAENLKEQALLIATVAAVVIGIGVGFALRGIKCMTSE